MNKIMLTARLGKDVEISYTKEKNTTVARFSIAVDSGWGENKRTDWLSCVAFGKTAELAEKYLQKGSPITIDDAEIQTGSYEKEGKKVFTTTIKINHFEFAMKDKLQGEREIESQVDSRVEKNTGIDVLDSAAAFELPMDWETDETSGLPF